MTTTDATDGTAESDGTDACRRDRFSSRTCERGTDTCVTRHARPEIDDAPPCPACGGFTIASMSPEAWAKFNDLVDNPPAPTEPLRKLLASAPEGTGASDAWLGLTDEAMDRHWARALDLLRADGLDPDAVLAAAAKNIEAWKMGPPPVASEPVAPDHEGHADGTGTCAGCADATELASRFGAITAALGLPPDATQSDRLARALALVTTEAVAPGESHLLRKWARSQWFAGLRAGIVVGGFAGIAAIALVRMFAP